MDPIPESRAVAPKQPGGAGTNPALLRRLGVLSAAALVVSNMVGTGIFTTSGLLAAELGVNFPSSGGEFVYLSRAYCPTWGFMTGWVSFFAGFSAAIAAGAKQAKASPHIVR